MDEAIMLPNRKMLAHEAPADIDICDGKSERAVGLVGKEDFAARSFFCPGDEVGFLLRRHVRILADALDNICVDYTGRPVARRSHADMRAEPRVRGIRPAMRTAKRY